MKRVLFVNAAFREGSRTARLAESYLGTLADAEIERVELGGGSAHFLDADRLKMYCADVASGVFEDPMYDVAKQFAAADEIVIAAPFWNMGIPAVLHMYLEMVCTQGISFGLSASGEYISLVKAKKLTYVTTAGGMIPVEDHGVGYVRQLNEYFWKIPEVKEIRADGIDIYGADVEAILAAALKK